MDTREITEAFLKAINTLDIDTAARYCAENFIYSGPPPKPLGIQEWREMAGTIRKAFPDWRFNPEIVRIEGNLVHILVHMGGAQKGELDLSALGMGVFPATGKSVSFPKTTGRVILQGNKVSSLKIDVEEGSGIPSILTQLGLTMPVR